MTAGDRRIAASHNRCLPQTAERRRAAPPTTDDQQERRQSAYGRDGRHAPEVRLVHGKWTEARSQMCADFQGLTSAHGGLAGRRACRPLHAVSQTAFTRCGCVAERAQHLLDVMIEESIVLLGRRLGSPIVLPPAASRARLRLPRQDRLLPPVVAEMLFSFVQVCPLTRTHASHPDLCDRAAERPRLLAWAQQHWPTRATRPGSADDSIRASMAAASRLPAGVQGGSALRVALRRERANFLGQLKDLAGQIQ
jgi:hypothetical protein